MSHSIILHSPWTWQQGIQHAIGKLADQVENPHLEAEIVLSYVLQVSRAQLYAWPDKLLTEQELKRFQAWVAQRAEGLPLAYLTGWKEFWSLELQVSTATLIPRPETELLVELALHRVAVEASDSILDLGTGSGAIALAIAWERKYCHVLAVDCCEQALVVARGNAQRLSINNVDFLHSDWFSQLDSQQFKLIVSNPPYIGCHETLDPSVTQEPLLALLAGEDGLSALRPIIEHAPVYLQPGGQLLLEHGYRQGQEVRDLLELRGFKEIFTALDGAGLERVSGGSVNSE